MRVWLKRGYLSIISIIKIGYWFFRRPKTEGSLAVVYKDKTKKEVLLIRKSYGRGKWSLPGGNIDKGETPEEAAIREVKEEVGLDVEISRKLGDFKEYEFFRDHTTHVFESFIKTDVIKIDPVEISEAKWFFLNKLPENRGKSIFEVLDLKKPH